MTTFVALGDSLTFGVGDAVGLAGARAWRGWAALALAIRERWSVSAATMDSVAAWPDAQPVR